CRAGTEAPFHYGNSLSSRQENFNGNSPYGDGAKGPFLQRTTKVGSYAANAWGLYDMHGNVFQWCRGWYDKDFKDADSKGASHRLGRGGAWFSAAKDCRAARRERVPPTARGSGLGFRVVVRLRAKAP